MDRGEIVKKTRKEFSLVKYRELLLIGIIVVLALIVQLRNDQFLTLKNIGDILVDTAILSMLAVGMMMVIITTGIDLSIASNMAFCGMAVSMYIFKVDNGLAPGLALLMAIVIGGALGVLNGLIISKGRVPAIIATLGTMNIYRGFTFIIGHGEWVNAHEMSDSFKQIALGKTFGINNLIFIAILCYIIFFYVLNYTKTGRRIYAVGSNSEAVRISGIHADRILIFVYTVMGMISGLSGVLWASRYAVAQGDSCLGYEMFVIASCVLGGVSISGGRGKIQGVLLGAILIGLINNALPMLLISHFWKQAIQGFIILLAILSNTIILRRSKARSIRRRSL